MKHSNINDVYHIKIQNIANESGNLTVIDEADDLSFPLRRVFTIAGVEANGKRGRHAHKQLNQVLACVSGEVKVIIDDASQTREITLNTQTGALHIPPGIWSEQIYKDPKSVLIICCDAPYDEADYIRDYDEFKQWRSDPVLTFTLMQKD